MSGSVLSQLGQAIMPPNFQAQQQSAINASVPLASMVNNLAPNAAELQGQYAQLPWWAVPGMFKIPMRPANQAMAATAAATPVQAPVPPELLNAGWWTGGLEGGDGGDAGGSGGMS